MLPSGYSGLQEVIAGYRMVIVGSSRLPQVTERVPWFTAGYSGYRVFIAGYSRLPQQVIEWLQWLTAG